MHEAIRQTGRFHGTLRSLKVFTSLPGIFWEDDCIPLRHISGADLHHGQRSCQYSRLALDLFYTAFVTRDWSDNLPLSNSSSAPRDA